VQQRQVCSVERGAHRGDARVERFLVRAAALDEQRGAGGGRVRDGGHQAEEWGRMLELKSKYEGGSSCLSFSR
jgi:hypothetical protein